MKIVIDLSLCDGNGNCVREAPDLLAMSDDETVKLVRETFGEDRRAAAQAAVNSCPKNALKLAD